MGMLAKDIEIMASPTMRAFSCLDCRNRKIKCDRNDPCTNCVKHSKLCQYITPVRGKRKRKAKQEGLHAKIRRYETLLKSYGAKVESTSDGEDSEMVASETEMTDLGSNHTIKSKSLKFDKGHSKLVARNGVSRYFENGAWSHLGNEFDHPGETDLADSAHTSSENHWSGPSLPTEGDITLLFGNFSRTGSLKPYHMTAKVAEQLMDVYTDRVDPWVKIVHVPSFRSSLQMALRNIDRVSTSLEALIFSFYLVTIASLDETECQNMMDEGKEILLQQYQAVSRQALINANILTTSNIVTLQAYVLYLVGARNHYVNDSTFILSGIAVRLARRMGLHRDGSSLGLSMFESEMRRRLWSQIRSIDCRVADFSGTRPSQDLFHSDTKRPSNIEDEDFGPETVGPVKERTGLTSVILASIRYDMTDFLCELASHTPNEVHWGALRDTSISLEEKDAFISKVEDQLESRYLRYCDITNPLHYVASIMCRSSVCKMKVVAHNPRQFSDRGLKVPQSSRDIIFASGGKLLEYAKSMRDNSTTTKFGWVFGYTYMWDAILYLLIELRHRKTGPDVDKTWDLIEILFVAFPKLSTIKYSDQLYYVLGIWTLQVWEECRSARLAEGLAEQPTPAFVIALRKRTSQRENLIPPVIEPDRVRSQTTGDGQSTSLEYGGDFSYGSGIVENVDLTDFNFSDLLSFETEPDAWMQWDRLTGGRNT